MSRLYEHFRGPKLSQVQAITAAEREVLWRCARSFNQVAPAPSTSKPSVGAGRPDDDFNARASWGHILTPHGWTEAHRKGAVTYWRRPDKDGRGWSATTGYCKAKDGTDLLAVFSSNAGPFQGPDAGRSCTCYSKFGAYALLNHDGKHKDAAKALGKQGYGEQRSTEARAEAPDNSRHAGPKVAAQSNGQHLPCNSGSGTEEEPPAAPVNLTDVGNARRVLKRHGHDLRYCHPWKSWLVWDGCRWRDDDTAEAVRRVKETQAHLYRWVGEQLRELGDAAQDDEEAKAQKAKLMRVLHHALKWEDDRRIVACLNQMKSEQGVPILPAQFDADPYALNLLNGTLDLRTGKLREHRREDLLTKLAPVRFDPTATAPLWERCLRRWMAENDDLVEYLRRVVGYAMTANVREQCLWFLYGLGSNGKSAFLQVLLHLLGDYAMQAVSELLMQKRNESHPTERADLFGRRFVATIETDDGK
jgi:hypothetical protein